MSSPAQSLGSIERTTPDGLKTTIADNPEEGQFEAMVDGQAVGWQPYRRYRDHIVLMRTEVDPQWRERGMSTALIDGTLRLIKNAKRTVVPRCKLTADYLLRHPQYEDLVPGQYRSLLRPVSRPPGTDRTTG